MTLILNRLNKFKIAQNKMQLIIKAKNSLKIRMYFLSNRILIIEQLLMTRGNV